MKTIRTLLLTSLASLLGLSLAQAANVPMTVTVNTSSSNSSYVYSTSMTVRLYNGNVIAVTPVTGQYTGSSGAYYTFTYSFSIPDTSIGLAVSVGNASTTGTGNKYFTALFTAAASVTIPGEAFPYSGPNATWPTSNTPTLPPPQTGDLTIRNFSTNPDGDLDFTMRLDIGSTRTDTHVTILSDTGLTTAPVPTLSQRFASQNGEWRWSLQTNATLPQEVKVMTLGATLSAPASNILSLYSAVIPPAIPSPTIKLDPGTGAAGTAKITIGTHTVLTDDVAAGLYLTQTAATSAYLTQLAADSRYPHNINGNFSEGIHAIATGGSSIAMGDYSWASGLSSTAIGGGSYAEGDYSTALGGSYAQGYAATSSGGGAATGDYATALGMGTASGIGATASGGSEAHGYCSVAMGLGTAWADYSTALGYSSYAGGLYSMATGVGSRATGKSSTAMGTNTAAQGQSQAVIGQFNIPQYSTPQVGNPSAWVLTDELFTIGNGIDNSTPSNAFVVLKNGDTAVSGKLTVVKDAAVTGNFTAQGTAHVVGTAQFDGRVYLIAPQGDLSMGDFTSVAPVVP